MWCAYRVGYKVLNEKIEEVFFSELKKIFNQLDILADFQELSSIWSLKGLKYYFSTLRNIYRYMNAINFRLPSIYKEINLNHFLIIEAIRIFDYKIYTLIYQAYLPWSKFFREDKSFIDKIDDASNTKSLVKYLWEGSSNFSISHSKAIFDARYFERYFALSIQVKDVSEQDFENFLNGTFDRKLFLEQIYKAERLNNLFEKLNSPLLSERYHIHDYLLIMQLIDFLDNYPELFSPNSPSIFDSIVNLVLSYPDKQDALHYLITEVAKPTNRMSLSRFYLLYYFRYDVTSNFKGSSLRKYEKLVNQRLNNINQSTAKFIKDWSANFLNKPSNCTYPNFLRMFLITFADIDPEGIKRSWDVIFEYPEELAEIAKLLIDLDPPSFDSSRAKKLFPEDYMGKFLISVKKADLDLVSKKNKAYLSFLKEYVQEIDDITLITGQN